VAPYIG